MDLNEAIILAKKLALREQTSADLQSISQFLRTASRSEAEAFMDQYYAAMQAKNDYLKADRQLLDRLHGLNLDRDIVERQYSGTVHRIHFLRTAWFRYAAAIIILFGLGTYVYINNQKEEPSVTQTSPVPMQNDVAPGGNRATLTLADGSKIILDSASTGELAREVNATITKSNDGRIVYNPYEQLGPKILYNTMTTPRGGQYQLQLPDGSQVWLNAASSITYPTAFTGNERKVSITGEVYFEVVHKAKQPFRVDIAEATIEVLGTHFNINAYSEEPTINTTLLEGSVRIKAVHTSLTLKSGQQGRLNDQRLSLAASPDLEQVMAWKNSTFHFNDATFQEISAYLERWYNVDFEVNGDLNDRYRIHISRKEPLSKILSLIESAGGIHFKMEGRHVKIYN